MKTAAFASFFLLVTIQSAQAAQSGPVFPGHHYPTDESFHIGYRLSYFTTSSNFASSMTFEKLDDEAGITLINHQILGEYQPNRRLSFGGILTLSSAAITPTSTDGTSDAKLGDQRIYAEYRFFDEPGSSLGAALMTKFPGYSNPTAAEIEESGKTSAVLVGDAQIDFTTLLTAELWPSNSMRFRFDGGYTFRTEQYAGEIPYLVALGYVTPKTDFEMRVRGNLAVGGGVHADDEAFNKVRAAFANSDFALSDSPAAYLILEPRVEFWVTPSLAITGDYAYSMMGVDSAHFHEMGIGLLYREAHTLRVPKRTFREVDIGVDQEAGQFQGESQQKELREQAAPDKKPVDEEF